ncbi:hypothetical protein M8C21_012670, partial [Ambrosia artemisiifolia]
MATSWLFNSEIKATSQGKAITRMQLNV